MKVNKHCPVCRFNLEEYFREQKYSIKDGKVNLKKDKDEEKNKKETMKLSS